MRHKSNSIINVAGLMVGFAAFLLIFLVVQYEQSFDNFHAKGNNIYRVVRIGKNPTNREYRTGVPFPVTPTLRSDFPQLANAAAIFGVGGVQINVTAPDGSTLKKFKEGNNVFIAEPQFFKMFDFGLVEGNIANAISDPNTALLTKEIASKYFGDWKTAMGKTLKIFGLPIKVTGVLDDPPSNTDFPLGVIVSYATLIKNGNGNDWDGISDQNYCFVQLSSNNAPEPFNKLLVGFVDKHIKPVNPNYDRYLVDVVKGIFSAYRSGVYHCLTDRMVFYASMVATLYLSYHDRNLVFCSDHFRIASYCLDNGGIYCDQGSAGESGEVVKNGISN
jgi:hypothetical protein